MTELRNPLADALAHYDLVRQVSRPDGTPSELAALRILAEVVRLDVLGNRPGELRATGVYDDAWQSPVALAEDYARWAAEQMNCSKAGDTEFIADGATVTAYTHGLAHMSATFELDESRPYPGDEEAPATCRYCGAEIQLPKTGASPQAQHCSRSVDHVHEPNEGYFEVTPADWAADGDEAEQYAPPF
jgi:hypothetical protein